MTKRILNIIRSLWNSVPSLFDSKLNDVLTLDIIRSKQVEKRECEDEVISILHEMKNKNIIKHISKDEIDSIVRGSSTVVATSSERGVDYFKLIMNSIINTTDKWEIYYYSYDLNHITIRLLSNIKVNVKFKYLNSTYSKELILNLNGEQLHYDRLNSLSKKVANICLSLVNIDRRNKLTDSMAEIKL